MAEQAGESGRARPGEVGALRSIVRTLMEGEVPVDEGAKGWWWYACDEDGIPRYRGDALSSLEAEALRRSVAFGSSGGSDG